MKLYHVSDGYVETLRKIDPHVYDNKNGRRPYVGVLVEVDGKSYYAPLTSPKPKFDKMHSRVDFRKIANGKLGAVCIGNMVPVPNVAVSEIDINSEPDIRYRRLLQSQYRWLSAHSSEIERDAAKLYSIITSDEKLSESDEKIKARCFDIRKFEPAIEEYQNAINAARLALQSACAELETLKTDIERTAADSQAN